MSCFIIVEMALHNTLHFYKSCIGTHRIITLMHLVNTGQHTFKKKINSSSHILLLRLIFTSKCEQIPDAQFECGT